MIAHFSALNSYFKRMYSVVLTACLKQASFLFGLYLLPSLQAVCPQTQIILEFFCLLLMLLLFLRFVLFCFFFLLLFFFVYHTVKSESWVAIDHSHGAEIHELSVSEKFTSAHPEIRPNFSGSHRFSLTATAKIGPDTNSLTFVLVTARFWP